MLLLYFFISAAILLFGAETNAESYRAVAEESGAASGQGRVDRSGQPASRDGADPPRSPSPRAYSAAALDLRDTHSARASEW